MRVQVYRNLHKSNETGAVYSVRDKKSRKVISHQQWLVLDNVKYYVSDKGRARVLREKKKNVHAWIEGDLCRQGESARSRINYCEWLANDSQFSHRWRMRDILYNPYKYEMFMAKQGFIVEGILTSEMALISPQGARALDYKDIYNFL
jgi:hypothetical protein